MLKTWLAYYLLFIHGLTISTKLLRCLCFICSVSLKDIYFYQQSMLVANNQISKQTNKQNANFSERIFTRKWKRQSFVSIVQVENFLCKGLAEKISSVNYQNHHDFRSVWSNMRLTIE